MSYTSYWYSNGWHLLNIHIFSSIEVDKFNPCNLTVSFHDWRESRDLEDFIVSMTRNATF